MTQAKKTYPRKLRLCAMCAAPVPYGAISACCHSAVRELTLSPDGIILTNKIVLETK